MNLLRQLDEVLFIIMRIDKNGNAGNISIHEITFQLLLKDTKLTVPLSDLIDKLLEDGFIITFQMDVVKNGIINPAVSHYTPTFKAFFLREDSGGYQGRHRQQAAKSVTSAVLNWSIAIGGGVAAIYYLLEIITKYVAPFFQHLFDSNPGCC